jgi:hypothetical protein
MNIAIKPLLLIIIFCSITNCATKSIKKSQDISCINYTSFPKYHECTEGVVKSTFKYKYGFEKDIIDSYFAYGEVLSIDVKKGRKENYEAFRIWGDELEKAVQQSEKKGKQAVKTTVITAMIAIAVYAIYKEYLEDNYRIDEANKVSDNVKSLQSSVTTSSWQNNQIRCNYGRAIFSRGGGYSPFLSSC